MRTRPIAPESGAPGHATGSGEWAPHLGLGRTLGQAKRTRLLERSPNCGRTANCAGKCCKAARPSQTAARVQHLHARIDRDRGPSRPGRAFRIGRAEGPGLAQAPFCGLQEPGNDLGPRSRVDWGPTEDSIRADPPAHHTCALHFGPVTRHKVTPVTPRKREWEKCALRSFEKRVF